MMMIGGTTAEAGAGTGAGPEGDEETKSDTVGRLLQGMLLPYFYRRNY